MTRVLILTASVGEGHDLPARLLAMELGQRGVDVQVRDGLAPMGELVRRINAELPRLIFFRWRWLYDPGFWLAARCPPTRWISQVLLGLTAAGGLERLARETAATVIVSTYPPTTEGLGWLKRRGVLRVPVCAVITDLAALRYWAARGLELHLVTHPESIPDVRKIAGARTSIRCVSGLIAPEFHSPREPAAARRALGLPADGKVVLLSGGGWGVGNFEQAIHVAGGVDGVASVVCLCGRNDRLRRRLVRTYRERPDVRIEPFTDVMAEWLAAADALVHSTGGLTVLEAMIRGCPVISFGWGRGHVRLNNRAYRRFGLAQVAHSRRELRSALEVALAEPRVPDLSLAELPPAADAVLELAGHEPTRTEVCGRRP